MALGLVSQDCIPRLGTQRHYEVHRFNLWMLAQWKGDASAILAFSVAGF